MTNNQPNEITFPEVTNVDMAFGGYPRKWFNDILINHKNNQKYEDMCQTLFFSGGKVKFKKELDPEYINKGVRMLKAVLGSFEPKHEHKMHVASIILETISDGIEKSE